MKKMQKTLLLVLPLAMGLLNGCTTVNPYTNEQQSANATSGSIIGAITGAAIGAASSSRGDRGKGILIGAASGAALGGGIGYYMDVQETKLRQQLKATGVSVTRDGDNIVLNMPNEVTFGVDQTVLNTSAKQVLNSIALVAQEYPKTKLTVFGYTDSTGSAAYNLRLSQVRAAEVSGYLIDLGLPSQRVSAVGKGETNPIATNKTREGRAQNRRVEIVMTPTSTR